MVEGRTKNATNPHKNDVGKLSFLTMNNFSMIIFWVWVRVEKRNFGFGLREKTLSLIRSRFTHINSNWPEPRKRELNTTTKNPFQSARTKSILFAKKKSLKPFLESRILFWGKLEYHFRIEYCFRVEYCFGVESCFRIEYRFRVEYYFGVEYCFEAEYYFREENYFRKVTKASVSVVHP